MWFGSDNLAAPAPEIWEAMRAAADYAPAYGEDDGSERARGMIREVFEAPRATVQFVASGTAANGLALSCLCPPWGAVFCHREAHVQTDECNGPEFFTGGAKLALAAGAHGRMKPETLRAAMATTSATDPHWPQPGALSLTNATEAGTVYAPEDIAALTAVAREAGIRTHMDGTRFANALAHLGCSPAELSWKAGVDILCLGATKNGALAAEAVIMFDPAQDYEFQLRRKRAGHLLSKMRFVAAQFEAMLTGDLWLRTAARSNAMCARLADGLRALPAAELVHEPQANLIFVRLPRGVHRRAREASAVYGVWASLDGPADEMLDCRLVCSNLTTEADVDALLAAFRG